uniref:GDNF family receptor alpha like n=1 Tax=Leptobrachium leishanense TaxID=445787 RepID=A0A8C5PTR7_9ANUR
MHTLLFKHLYWIQFEMKYLSCTAILFFLTQSVSEATECSHLKEICKNTKNECGSVWNILENVCNLSENNCQVKGPCNITIYYFIEKFPKFKDCICIDDLYCSIKRLLGKECHLNNAHIFPTEPYKSATSLLKKNSIHVPQLMDAIPLGKTSDCHLAKQLCKENQNCVSVYENFRSNCAIDLCTLPGGKQRCLSARSELKATTLGNCVCLKPTKEKCLKIWNTIHNSSCLHHSKEKKTFSNTGGIIEEFKDSYPINSNIKLEWETSSLSRIEYASPMNCFKVAALCTGDSVCNRYLVSLIKTCTPHGKVCNAKDCQKIIRSFYDKMPFNISQILAFCYCPSSDNNCTSAEKVLHSKPCAIQADVPTSCLSIIHKCLADDVCRQRYEKYEAKCWKQVTKCYNNERCLSALDLEDLTCSRTDECKAAYISILGTKLLQQCTCTKEQHNNEEHLCSLYYHILHSKSCIEKYTSRNLHASYSDILNKQQMMSPRSFYNGPVIYIVAYTSGIILVSGIILLTLLQTRAYRAQKKRNLPKGNVSESLMNS